MPIAQTHLGRAEQLGKPGYKKARMQVGWSVRSGITEERRGRDGEREREREREVMDVVAVALCQHQERYRCRETSLSGSHFSPKAT